MPGDPQPPQGGMIQKIRGCLALPVLVAISLYQWLKGGGGRGDSGETGKK
jgi:hypothetical protein